MREKTCAKRERLITWVQLVTVTLSRTRSMGWPRTSERLPCWLSRPHVGHSPLHGREERVSIRSRPGPAADFTGKPQHTPPASATSASRPYNVTCGLQSFKIQRNFPCFRSLHCQCISSLSASESPSLSFSVHFLPPTMTQSSVQCA